jgi:hypothetical protein
MQAVFLCSLFGLACHHPAPHLGLGYCKFDFGSKIQSRPGLIHLLQSGLIAGQDNVTILAVVGADGNI